jgi:hypothetical protein
MSGQDGGDCRNDCHGGSLLTMGAAAVVRAATEWAAEVSSVQGHGSQG